MKKKPVFWVILIVVAVLVVSGAIFGKQYYDNRYVGKDYYTMVPANYDITPEALYQMDGKTQEGTGVKYKLEAYNDQGEATTVEFVVREGNDAPQPGTYLYVSASNELVLNWYVTEEGNVPEKALSKIKA